MVETLVPQVPQSKPSKQRDDDRRRVESRLWGELRRLKRILDTGYGLRVEWRPNGSNSLEGEIKGDIIYLYSKDPVKVVKTLRHEFIDYAVSEVIEPYKEVTNALISTVNKNAYRKKERLVEALAQLM